jgi:hypothetical protein
VIYLSAHENFLQAIHNKQLVSITFNSHEKGIITRTCVPYDYGPSNKYQDKSNRYHFHDLNSPDGSHPLSILPKDLKQLQILDTYFNPSTYVKWTPKWHFQRDWGEYS